MRGRDKALVMLGGRTLLARACERLAPQVSRLAVSVNGDAGRYARALPGIAAIADADDSRAGPLAGILAGLRWAAALPQPPQALVSAAVDTPFFPLDLVERLAAAASARPAAVALAASANAPHPTFALWPLGLADDLAAHLAGGERRVRAFIARHPNVTVDFPLAGGRDPFFNVNTPEELAAAQALVEKAP